MFVFFYPQVADQKNTRSGEAAPVVFSEIEYVALGLYVQKLRNKLVGDDETLNVEPARRTKFKKSEHLGFSSVYNILQKFTTYSGKKVSSRSIRGSKVTNSRKINDVYYHMSLPTTMSLTLRTANSNYNYDKISNNVRKTLAVSKSINESIEEFGNVSFRDLSVEEGNTSTPLKRKAVESEVDNITKQEN